eukprot:4817109-Prymnesium_polylepis.1
MDPDGTHLAKVREHLKNNPQIKRLWYDAWCIAQGERSAIDKADFKRMLTQVRGCGGTRALWACLGIGCEALTCVLEPDSPVPFPSPSPIGQPALPRHERAAA